jgi:chromosome segregation ATPase
MKKTALAVLAVFCVFMFAACAKAKPTKAEHITHLKAKMYEVDRKIHKIEKTVAQKTAKTKKQKAQNADMKKALETAKKDLDALQERVDGLASVTKEAWDGFTASLEQGMDRLNNNIERLMGAYREKQQEETQPQ